MPAPYHRSLARTTGAVGLLAAGAAGSAAAVAGPVGGLVGVVAVVAAVAWSAYAGDRLLLHAVRARPLSEAQHPALHRIVRELAKAGRQPVPRVYLSPLEAPNAFATGRSPRAASVCVTAGLLQLLDERELRAALAHELAHVRARDTLVVSLAAGVAGAVLALAAVAALAAPGGDDEDGGGLLSGLLLLLLGPVAAVLLRLSLAPEREHRADLDAVRTTGDPAALASALRKLEVGTRVIRLPLRPAVRPARALMLVDPGRGGRRRGLLSSHPPVRERVARLESLGGR